MKYLRIGHIYYIIHVIYICTRHYTQRRSLPVSASVSLSEPVSSVFSIVICLNYQQLISQM